MRTIKVKPRYESLRPWLEQLPDIFEQQGEHVYGGKRNWIKLFETPSGLRLNVKRYHAPRFLNLLVYSYGLRKPKGERAWQYPDILLAKGIQTPEVVALIEEHNRLNLLGYSYLITLQVDWNHTLYEFGDAKPGEYEEAAKALGRFAAYMHDQEVMHKDFTPGNILWKKDNEGYHFCVVDINRMYFGPVTPKAGLGNLVRFWGPKGFTELLVSEYARLRGIDPHEAIAIAMPARAKFWRRYQKKHHIPFRLEL
jgi:hypothetical protein